MNIRQVYASQMPYPKTLYNSKVGTPIQNKAAADVLLNKNLPSNVIKANFIPAFGRYTKIKEVELTNNATGEPVKGILFHDKFGDYYEYFKITVNHSEAGFMELAYNRDCPRFDLINLQNNTDIPMVSRIYSRRGDKYKGIGTALINQAIEESRKRGSKGQLWLISETGFASEIAKHRRNTNPIPFYYGMGFKCIFPEFDEHIKNCLLNKNYDELPKSAILFLPEQKEITNNKTK